MFVESIIPKCYFFNAKIGTIFEYYQIIREKKERDTHVLAVPLSSFYNLALPAAPHATAPLGIAARAWIAFSCFNGRFGQRHLNVYYFLFHFWLCILSHLTIVFLPLII